MNSDDHTFSSNGHYRPNANASSADPTPDQALEQAGGELDCDNWELQIEGLVQGELNMRTRQALLRRADDEPARWREIALAFVEHQVLGECIPSWLQTPSAPTKTSATSPGIGSASIPALSDLVDQATTAQRRKAARVFSPGTHGAPSYSDTPSSVGDTKSLAAFNSRHVAEETVSSLPSRASNSVVTRWNLLKWTSGWWTAACICFALVGGYLIGFHLTGWTSHSVDDSGGAMVNEAGPFDEIVGGDRRTDPNASSGRMAALPPVSSVANRQTVLKIPTRERDGFWEIPMREAPSLDVSEEAGSPPEPFIPEFRQALTRQGYQLTPRTHYVRGQLEDDREFVFPVYEWTFESTIQ